MKVKRPDWLPDWRGETCIIIASGPSAADAGIDQARGKARCVVVNSSYRLAPWADALFACDYAWWQAERGCKHFAGLRLTTEARAAMEFGVQKVGLRRGDDRLLLEEPGTVGGSNSGQQAFNLVLQTGCSKVVLVGFDMTLRGARAHWHGRHAAGLHNPTPRALERWRRAMDAAAKRLPAGVQVINAGMASALTAYPKKSLSEALRAA